MKLIIQHRRFRETVAAGKLPTCILDSLCLCLDEASLRSILLGSAGLAHLLAVSNSCGLPMTGDEADNESWTGSFKVAVHALVTEIYAIMGGGDFTPYELGVGITPDLVYCGIGRYGRKPASVL